jgi:hypothetical protein
MSRGADERDDAAVDDTRVEPPIEAVDVLLGQGDPQACAEWRQRVATDAAAMLEMADTVALVEGLRTVRIDASEEPSCRLWGVVRRAERRVPPRPRSKTFPLLCAAAAAIVTFLLLIGSNPLRPARTQDVASNPLPPAPPAVTGSPSTPGAAGVAAWQSVVEQVRERLGVQPAANLREAWETGLDDQRDALARWLDPRNAVVLMRLDHELRASASVRREALRRQGALADNDARVQQLADGIAGQLPWHLMLWRPEDSAPVSRAVRALIAAGPSSGIRDDALRAGSAWLARRANVATGTELVQVLAGLVEASAVTGEHADVARVEGTRLLDELLRPDGENWSRRVPELLGPRVPAAVLADAGRLLVLLPGFGADASRCGVARRLLLAQLRERRAAGQDSPELVAAILFGSADLLADEERDALELRLRHWQPHRLLPDYTTVHLMAWALEPGRRGFTRWQSDLRMLAVQPDPETMDERAAFCLSLATSYAAFGNGVLRRVASGI